MFLHSKPISDNFLKWTKKGKTGILSVEKTKKIFDLNPAHLTVSFPFPDGEKTIEFEQNNIHAPGFQVFDSKNKSIEGVLKMPVHFKGKNNKRGVETSSLSIFSNGEIVLVYSDKNGNINIARLQENIGASNEYIIFNEADLMDKNPFACNADELPKINNNNSNIPNPNQVQNDSACRLTEIYWECDYNMFTKGGNSLQTTLNTFEAMFNGTAVLYEAENINIGVKAVKIWNIPDPYNYQTSFTALDDFQSAGNTANWPGQLAHLLSTRELNLGGVAYINGLCGSNRYGFSNIDFFFNPLPMYSWTLSTIAHELGHNFSSPHTHNCNWQLSPGVFGQIDSCWTAEGNCQPIRKGRTGTIMSYCHLTGNVNLSLGFGPLPGNRIRNGYANMSCVSGSIVIPDFIPIVANDQFCLGDTIQLSAENLPGFSYSWSGPGAFTSNLRTPAIPNATSSTEGIYLLKVKKASCESRQKSLKLTFNCMKVGYLPNMICAGSNLFIPFTSTGIFNSGNLFIVQLSNRLGSFATPINLDTIGATIPQLITTKIPSQLLSGENYKIRLLSTNPTYEGKPGLKSFIVNNEGFSPSPRNGERCGPGILQLSVEGGSNITWFNSPFDFEPIFFGRNFGTPFLNTSKNYYAQSGSTTKGKAGLKKELANTSSTVPNGLQFDVYTTLRLDSISLLHGYFSGKLCRVRITKNGYELFGKLIFANGTNTKVALFWKLDPGNGYELVADSVNFPLSMAEGSMVQYPITTVGLVSVSNNSNTLSNNYPYFFSWVVSEYLSCPSAKIEVKATIKPGIVPATPQIEVLGFDSLQINQSGIQFQWNVNGQVNSQVNGPKIKGLLNSVYQVRYKIDSCWSDWSASKIFLTTSIAISLAESLPKIYPNPTQGNIEIEPGNAEIRILLCNSSGKILFQKTITKKETILLNPYSSGIYAIKWTGEKSNGTLKIVKE